MTIETGSGASQNLGEIAKESPAERPLTFQSHGQSKGLPVLSAAIMRTWGPCYDPSRYWGDDWRGTIVDILQDDRVPIVEKIWLTTNALESGQLQRFACWCAREAIRLSYPKHPSDLRSVTAIDVAERFAAGQATAVELKEACVAARDAARSLPEGAARYAAMSAVWSAASSQAESALLSAAVSLTESPEKSVAQGTGTRAFATAARIAARRAETSAAFGTALNAAKSFAELQVEGDAESAAWIAARNVALNQQRIYLLGATVSASQSG